MAIPNMAMIPSGYKPTKLYSVLPTPSYGSNVVTNGDFSNGSTGWDLDSPITISGGTMNFTNVGGKYGSQDIGFTNGTTYLLEFEITQENSGALTVFLGGGNGIGNVSGLGKKQIVAVADSTFDTKIYFGNNFSGSIDNISVKEVFVGDADFDVSRASSATRVNAQGLIETPEFILSDELVSNGNFSNGSADWDISASGTSSVVFTDVATLNIDGSNSNVGIYQQNVFSSGKEYKISVRMKASANFDVEVLESQGAALESSIATNIALTTSYQDFTFYHTAVGTNDIFVHRLFSASGANESITIDNISIVQVEREDIPRLDYTDGGCPILLTEPQSTNLMVKSNELVGLGGGVAELNSGISPDGTQNATKVTFGASLNDGAALYISGSAAIANTEHTFSVYAKSLVGDGKFNVRIDTNTGVEVGSQNITATTEWQRYSFQFTTDASSSTFSSNSRIRKIGNPNNEILFYGLQMEKLSYPTSLMPTYGAISTRASETITNSGDVNTFNSTEGTLFVEIAALADDGTDRVISLNSGSFNNRIQVNYATTSNQLSGVVQTNGVYSLNATTTLSDVTEIAKIAVKYKQNDFALWVNGVEVGASTSGNTPIGLNNLDFSISDVVNFYGKTSQIQVFNTALSDYELELLTGGGILYDSYEEMRLALNYNIQ